MGSLAVTGEQTTIYMRVSHSPAMFLSRTLAMSCSLRQSSESLIICEGESA